MIPATEENIVTIRQSLYSEFGECTYPAEKKIPHPPTGSIFEASEEIEADDTVQPLDVTLRQYFTGRIPVGIFQITGYIEDTVQKETRVFVRLRRPENGRHISVLCNTKDKMLDWRKVKRHQ